MSENVHCARCDTPNPPGASFCIACSARLGAGAAQQPAPRAVAEAAPARRCPSCGGANPGVARYCVTCGASLAAPERRTVAGAPQPGYAPGMPALAAAGGYTVVQHIYMTGPAELPLVVRALWFFFVGLPLGLAWLLVAWAFNLTLIGLPLGLWMLTMMPQVMTLRQARPQPPRGPAQAAGSVAVRALYFVTIGWWLSLLWLMMGWGLAATVIGLPLAFLMFERTGAVLTLADA